MRAAFDHTATGYDSGFTNTPIGRLQRESVWAYLQDTFNDGFPEKVLELNCGTGEDAVFFANHGSNVLATDVSEKMLEVTQDKIAQHDLTGKITTGRLDIFNIGNETFDDRFDLVFSNFGGLNCVDAGTLQSLFEKMPAQLNPGGRMILVIMPRFCAWESIYFLSRLRVGEAFRRRKKDGQQASIGDASITTWYHDPAQVQEWSSAYFKIKHIQPIGIAVPPSYFKKTFINHHKILKNLNAAEKKLNKFKPLSRMADHYLIDLELK
jgi:SAM-dependent methyltransferase